MSSRNHFCFLAFFFLCTACGANGTDNIEKVPPLWLGPSLILFSGILYGIGGVLVKYLSMHHISVAQMVLVRKLFEGIMSFLSLRYSKMPLFNRKKRKYIFAAGCVVSCGAFFSFISFKLTDVGNAITIMALCPLISAPAAWYFLKERIHHTYPVVVFSCVLGTILIVQPRVFFPKSHPTEESIEGYLFAVSFAILYGVYFVIQRSGRLHPNYVVFWGSIVAIFASIICFIIDPSMWDPLSNTQIFYILLLSLFSYGGLVSRTYGMNYTPSNVASIMISSETIAAYISEYIFLNMEDNPVQYAGAVVILIGIGWLAFLKQPAEDEIRFDQLSDSEDDSLGLELPGVDSPGVINSSNYIQVARALKKELEQAKMDASEMLVEEEDLDLGAKTILRRRRH